MKSYISDEALREAEIFDQSLSSSPLSRKPIEILKLMLERYSHSMLDLSKLLNCRDQSNNTYTAISDVTSMLIGYDVGLFAVHPEKGQSEDEDSDSGKNDDQHIELQWAQALSKSKWYIFEELVVSILKSIESCHVKTYGRVGLCKNENSIFSFYA